MVEQLRDHWEWRPDWAVERPCLMWYLTFEQHPGLVELTERMHARLAGTPTVDLVPASWLHLTLEEVGFVDAVPPEQVDAVLASARSALEGWRPSPLTLGPVTAMADAVVLQAAADADLDELHRRLRAGTTAALGREPAHDPEGFWAHVSVAYSNGTCDAPAVLAPLGEVAAERVVVEAARLTLASVTRRDRHYQWTERGAIPLGV